MNKLYKAKEVAKILQVDAQTVYRLGYRGELNTIKIGRSVRYELPSELQKESEDKTECHTDYE